MIVIVLNKVEQQLARTVAKLRHENNRNDNVYNAKIGPQSNADTDLEGIAAEIAYCKLMNVYPDLDIDKGRPDWDAILKNGATVDVKATIYPNGKLLARPIKSMKPPDLYALMVGKFPKYALAGHMSAEELLVPDRIGSLGYGATYIARQSELEGVPHDI